MLQRNSDPTFKQQDKQTARSNITSTMAGLEHQHEVPLQQMKRAFKTFDLGCKDILYIDMKFWKSFKNELSEIWYLIDEEGRLSNVKIKQLDKERVVLDQGWPQFRKSHGVFDERVILFTYLGESKFHVKFFKKDEELRKVKAELKKKLAELLGVDVSAFGSEDGPDHIHQYLEPPTNQIINQANRIEFTEKLTEYKATKSQINLKREFAEFILGKQFKELNLSIGYGTVYNCKLLFDKKRPKSVKIGKGWKQFCKYAEFKKNDDILFIFEKENEYYVDVTKV